jgi:hypothetical protein
MESIELLKKYMNETNKDTILHKCYADSMRENYSTPEEAFKICVDDIKLMSTVLYDFQVIKTEAKSFNISRPDYRELGEHVCKLLGKKVTEVCYQTIFVEPSNFEDYCPFGGKEIVMYCVRPYDAGKIIISSDRDTYKIETVRPEITPYYEIYIHKIEKIK